MEPVGHQEKPAAAPGMPLLIDGDVSGCYKVIYPIGDQMLEEEGLQEDKQVGEEPAGDIGDRPPAFHSSGLERRLQVYEDIIYHKII